MDEEIAKQMQWENRYDIKTGEGFDKALVEDIETVILPFFESIPDAESFIKHLEQDEPEGFIDEAMMFQVGHLYYYNGEQEKGRALLKKIPIWFLQGTNPI